MNYFNQGKLHSRYWCFTSSPGWKRSTSITCPAVCWMHGRALNTYQNSGAQSQPHGFLFWEWSYSPALFSTEMKWHCLHREWDEEEEDDRAWPRGSVQPASHFKVKVRCLPRDARLVKALLTQGRRTRIHLAQHHPHAAAASLCSVMASVWEGVSKRRRVMCGDCWCNCRAKEAMGRPTFVIPLILFAVLLTLAQAKNVRFRFSSCRQIERREFDPASRTGWFCTAIGCTLTWNRLGNRFTCFGFCLFFLNTRLQKLATCSAIALYVYL